MTRIRRGSTAGLIARLNRPAAVSVLSTAMLLGTVGPAAADPQPGPDGIAALIAQIADANQQLQELGNQIAAEKEGVNKAIVDVETARDAAAAAQQQVSTDQQAVRDADAAISAAQRRVNGYAAATYMNGPSDSYLTAGGPDEMIATAAAGKAVADGSQQIMTDLHRARTEQINRESTARATKQQADAAVAAAEASQATAVSTLTDTQRRFGEQQGEINRLAARRADAQARLAAARGLSNGPGAVAPRAPAPGGPVDRWGSEPGPAPAPAPAGGPAKWDGEWDPTLPMVPSANIEGDPIAVINRVLGISQTSAQVTANMGHQFLESVGLVKPGQSDSGITNGRIPRVYGRRATEYVIRRGLAQRGVPYSWGGGNAAGPSKGIGSGAGTTGFDCSGLVLYAFAGVGIKLPHYSGSQYKMGRQIPSSQMRRGDVIFYGPGGSQHVTIYLGNGLMLEAPDVGQTVKVSKVRTSGMTPYVVRYIEW